MASTPPRSHSPHVTVPRSCHPLQISPNLEALLEHDDLTRRNSGSPTGLHNQIPHLSSGFAISLPPPPPRNAQAGKKPGYRDQETASVTRTKDIHRKKNVNANCDSWSNSFPILASDSVMTQPTSATTSSRPVTPNPYINPTPPLRAINTPDGLEVDESALPKQVSKFCLNEHTYGSSRSTTEARSHSTAPDSTHRSSPAFYKVEKILSKGRDSLSLFASTASAPKLKLNGQEPDRRSSRTGCVDLSVGHPAVQDNQTQQVPAVPTQRVSDPFSQFGCGDTATVLSPRSTTPYLTTPQQQPHLALFEGSSTRSPSIYSESSYAYNNDSSSVRTHCTTSLPHLPLPFMHCSQPPRLQPVECVTGNDQMSFMDLFTTSTSDNSIFQNVQNNSEEISPARLQHPSLSIPPSKFYSSSSHNLSSTSLASMKFAPPSPTTLAEDYPSPVYHCSDSPSSSSIVLSTMVFAPPSPSGTEPASPTFPRPVSPASSTYSLDPLEFAPPTSPGPDFLSKTLSTVPELGLECGRRGETDKHFVSASPHSVHHSVSPLPPTTNWLDANERAERIRRNRKLTQVFGRTPVAEGLVSDADEPRSLKRLPPPVLTGLLDAAKQKNHRHAMSVSVAVKTPGLHTEHTTPWQIDNMWSPGGRRHSIPLSPSSFTFYVDDAQNVTSANDQCGDGRVPSPTSFIDLSDEEVTRDDASVAISFLDIPNQNRRQHLHHSSSTPSFVETLDPDEQAEAERRRKREKLAKLHRFLGSRVPPEVVTGCITGSPLPPMVMPEECMRENWLLGRRSESAAPLEYFDRGKEELDEREKALNVRRAQKMERVFGTPPPQTLFHTRQGRPSLPHSQPTSPTIPSSTTPFAVSPNVPPGCRNLNQSAYKSKRTHRPGTSDSSKCLLPPNAGDSSSFAGSFPESFSDYQDILALSSVYLNYQHSLNSLVDIIDRDDRESLVELHRFLRGEVTETSPEEETPVHVRRMSTASSLRSERRHSLPTKASSTSLSSEFTLSLESKRSEFQLRRRRAAKLTHFFGVDYRELVHDVLESIEKGVEEERRRGTLQPEEVEVLLERVRSLRTHQS
ncbi:hypothetical protein PAXRUDRAFT_821016 [Paxillus rubicundulus Ve08.2h10]|uniref:Uncharacterized protein n=1 Tax=Paxillus rubicundulus Ve08.2h10 TaxID=930991 RepID=A0A0D0DPK3_9AGAM|nr:hypothetical protein PAXRUDRAFT_821016 [Paxillus rubicundulus Ve08.2h10]